MSATKGGFRNNSSKGSDCSRVHHSFTQQTPKFTPLLSEWVIGTGFLTLHWAEVFKWHSLTEWFYFSWRDARSWAREPWLPEHLGPQLLPSGPLILWLMPEMLWPRPPFQSFFFSIHQKHHDLMLRRCNTIKSVIFPAYELLVEMERKLTCMHFSERKVSFVLFFSFLFFSFNLDCA